MIQQVSLAAVSQPALNMSGCFASDLTWFFESAEATVPKAESYTQSGCIATCLEFGDQEEELQLTQ